MSTVDGLDLPAYGIKASKQDSSQKASLIDKLLSTSSAKEALAESDPSDMVDLSDNAKKILSRAKTDQDVADKLEAYVQSLLHPDDDKKVHSKIKIPQSAEGAVWQAGSKYGDPSISDADFIEKHKAALLNGVAEDKRPALEAAIKNGTVEFYRAEDVPGLNYHSTVTYSGVSGGLEGMSVVSSSHPTGQVKEALDQGHAYVFWNEDRGDTYVTW